MSRKTSALFCFIHFSIWVRLATWPLSRNRNSFITWMTQNDPEWLLSSTVKANWMSDEADIRPADATQTAELFHLSSVLNQAPKFWTVPHKSTYRPTPSVAPSSIPAACKYSDDKEKITITSVFFQSADSSKKSDANPLTEILKNPTKVVLLRVRVSLCAVKFPLSRFGYYSIRKMISGL